MDNETAKKINENLTKLNEIMHTFLFIAIKDSTLNKLNENQIKEISPSVKSLAKTIYENLNK